MFWARQELYSAAHDGTLCLVLGAGCVQDLGVPMWGALIDQLCGQLELATANKGQRDLTLLFDLLDQRGEATKALASCLYPAAKKEISCHSGEGHAVCYLAKLAIMLAERHPDKGIHVITYNMDTLLEEAIMSNGHDAVAITRDKRIQFRHGHRWKSSSWPQRYRRTGTDIEPAEGPPIELGATRSTVNIFHPHGIIDRKGNDLDIILGRSGYNELYRDLSDMRNLIQLSAFRLRRCLFYGFSFSDPNVDRLLAMAHTRHLSDRSTPRHFGLLKDASLGKERHPCQHGEFPDNWKIEARVTEHLRRLGVYRLGAYSYEQHKLVVEDICRQFQRRSVGSAI